MEDVKYNGRWASQPKNCQIVKFGITFELENRAKITQIFSKLLKNRFLKIDHDYSYKRGYQIDDLISKLNRRYKKELGEATVNVLTELGCTDIVKEVSKYKTFHDIFSCTTPFGQRRIFGLVISYDNGYQYKHELSVLGFRLMEATCCGILNFKNPEGGLTAVVDEDFTKHYDLIKGELIKISKEFEVMNFVFATTYI